MMKSGENCVKVIEELVHWNDVLFNVDKTLYTNKKISYGAAEQSDFDYLIFLGEAAAEVV